MRQFSPSDTSAWNDRYGTGVDGVLTVAADANYDGANAGLSGSYTVNPLVPNPTITIDIVSTFANGDLIMIHQTRGANAGLWELNRVKVGGGTTSLELSYPLENNYLDDSGVNQAQILELKQYTDVTINATRMLSAVAWDGNKGGIAAFVANGVVTVTGSISATAKGFRAGSITYLSGNNSCNSNTGSGEGTVGASAVQTTPRGNGGGAGTNWNGSDPSGSGGGASHGTAGTAGNGYSFGGCTPAGGHAGLTVGTASLTTMNFGGAGGSSGAEPSDLANGNAGGIGGGIVFIAAKTLTTTGSIASNGQNGSNIATSSGGGGGAGGSVLVKGETLTLGSGLITASGGAGGIRASRNTGGTGGQGRIHADHTALTGTTTPTLDSQQSELYSSIYAHEGVFSTVNGALQQEKYKKITEVVSI